MATGTPGFVGARLKEAREARGKTGVQLIEDLDARGLTISSSSITKYEDVTPASPSPEVFAAMADILGMPQTFFLQKPRAEETRTIFYRSQAAATKRARARAEKKLDWLADVSIYLQGFASFPEVNLPKVGLPADPVLISDDDVEHAAQEARRIWRVNPYAPIGNMTALLENQGVTVAYQSLDADTLDSLSAFDTRDGRPYVMVGTEKSSSARWRFDLAHELGHLLLHQGVTQRQWNTAEVFKRIEQQANRFAGAFLLPLEPFSEELYSADLNLMRNLKMRWGVSIGAMISRAHQLDLISDKTARSLWIGLSRRGWRKCEPLDRETMCEEPALLRDAFEVIFENRAQTLRDLESALPLAKVDIERLAGLPRGYFDGGFTPGKVVQLFSK